jgi:small subunit ribosomal protein S5
MTKDTDTIEKEKEKEETTVKEDKVEDSESNDDKETDDSDNTDSRQKNRNKRQSRRGGRGRRDDFEAEIIDVRRVTRVVAGGRRFSFRVAAVAGDHKGKVGVGLGKANDISDAIGKAINTAKKNAVKIPLTDEESIPHEIYAKYNASKVMMYPAPGRGLVSGSSVRDVVRLAGIKDVSTKLLSRSKNKLNNARVAVAALKKLRHKEK